MSLEAIILKEGANPDVRLIAYETYKKEKAEILKQEFGENEWITIIHMALPTVIFDYMHFYRFIKALMNVAQCTIAHVTG